MDLFSRCLCGGRAECGGRCTCCVNGRGEGGAFLPPRFIFTECLWSAASGRHFGRHWSGIRLRHIMEEKCSNDLQSCPLGQRYRLQCRRPAHGDWTASWDKRGRKGKAPPPHSHWVPLTRGGEALSLPALHPEQMSPLPSAPSLGGVPTCVASETHFFCPSVERCPGSTPAPFPFLLVPSFSSCPVARRLGTSCVLGKYVKR